MSRIIVTGASGFVGRHVLEELLASDVEIHALSFQSPHFYEKQVHWHRVDLLDDGMARKTVEKIKGTHLLHLAWATHPEDYRDSPKNTRWLEASKRLFLEFKKNGGKRILGVGSAAEYGSHSQPCEENLTELRPTTLYGTCKKNLFQFMMRLFGEAGGGGAWSRLFSLYGPFEAPSRLLPSLFQTLEEGKPFPATQGTQVRDYLYVKDAAAALVKLLLSELSGPINIGSGIPLSVRNLIEKMAGLLRWEGLIRWGDISSSGEAPFLVADTSRLRRELHWQPRVELSEGLRRTYAWWSRKTHDKK